MSTHLGSVAMLISFLAYWNNHPLIITPGAMPALQRLAVVAYVIMLLSFGSIGWGLHRFYRTKIRDAVRHRTVGDKAILSLTLPSYCDKIC